MELALWCEANGLAAERTKHLARAVLTEPNNVKARALMGLLKYAGRWETPETVSRKVQADESLTARLAEYNTRRAALEDKDPSAGHRDRKTLAREHDELGLWCQANGLKAEASAHFTQAVVLNPYRETSWRHLGYVNRDGRWMSPEKAEAEHKEELAQRRADQKWEPLLKKYRLWLDEPSRRIEALRALESLDDPRAVASLVKVFGRGSKADQLVAVKTLNKMIDPGATRELAILAVITTHDEVRWTATELLRKRDRRDFAGMLVDQIRTPMEYQVQPVGGPNKPGGILIKTPRFKVLRTYDAPPVAMSRFDFIQQFMRYDENGLPIHPFYGHILDRNFQVSAVNPAQGRLLQVMLSQLITVANLKAIDSQQRLLADLETIECSNQQAIKANAAIGTVLMASLDAPDLKDDEVAWNQWWFDQVGYRYERSEPETVVVNASPQPPPPAVLSCFAAGTMVRTLDGRRAIESIHVGDQVLTQDTATGALSFETVNVVHHNPPSATVKVALDNGETLTASIYHRFYRAGRGWAMARELKPGDVLRTLGGLARIVSAESGATVPVYNLDVAHTRTFFVGTNDALVHDNTLPDPHARLFDARPATLAVSVR